MIIKNLQINACAKINLGLDVLRKRPDGYHDLRMIMQTVSLHDTVNLTATRAPGIRLQCSGQVPANEDNLAFKAAKLLMDEFSLPDGIYIDLIKHIPVAAGLAGGSTDAAAVLTGMNRMFALGLTQEQLMKRGVMLGADVPYCIMQGTALAEGIGDILTPLDPVPPCKILLVKPPIHVSTKYVYGHLKADEITRHPDIDGQIRALREQDLKALAAKMENVLETVTIPAYPEIREIKERLLALGAVNALMSGSGPSVFGIFEDEKTARQACIMLKTETMYQVFQTDLVFPKTKKDNQYGPE